MFLLNAWAEAPWESLTSKPWEQDIQCQPAKSHEANSCTQLGQLQELWLRSRKLNEADPFGTQATIDEDEKINFEASKLTESCLDELYHQCYPNLKSQMNYSELESLFKTWTQNNYLRMKTPEVHCMHRAKILVDELSKKGFQSKILFIDQSPTLIAATVDKSGLATGDYTDYQGTHWIVSVQTDEGEKILDPQFMNQPMNKEEYFKKTTGQLCTLDQDSKTPRNFSDWDCTYRYHTSSWLPLVGEDQTMSIINKNGGCGESMLMQFKKSIDYVNKWDFTSSKKIPDEIFKDENFREKLILKAYENAPKTLKDQVQNNLN